MKVDKSGRVIYQYKNAGKWLIVINSSAGQYD